MIEVVVEDVAFVETDAIVRPATDTLAPMSSALRRLEQIGGESFLAGLRTQQPLPVGSATVTPGGELGAEFVVHAIIRSDEEPVTATGVRRSLESVLHRAAAWEFRSLAIPPIGVGPGNLSIEDAAKILAAVLAEHVPQMGFPTVIKVVVENEDEKALFEGLLQGTK